MELRKLLIAAEPRDVGPSAGGRVNSVEVVSEFGVVEVVVMDVSLQFVEETEVLAAAMGSVCVPWPEMTMVEVQARLLVLTVVTMASTVVLSMMVTMDMPAGEVVEVDPVRVSVVVPCRRQ